MIQSASFPIQGPRQARMSTGRHMPGRSRPGPASLPPGAGFIVALPVGLVIWIGLLTWWLT